jgi:hypothetical protein
MDRHQHRPSGRNFVRALACLAAAPLALGLGACEQEVTEDPPGEVGEVEVVYGDTRVTVDLGDVAEVLREDGEGYARLSDVVEAAGIGADLSAMEYDFEGVDGYRPSARSTCAGVVPVTFAVLEGGYVHRTNRNLAWDDALEMPGCAHVDETARVHVVGAGTLRRTVEVEYDGEVTTVDLRDLEREDIDGAPHVRLDAIVEAAELGVSLSLLAFDFAAGDGYRPSSSGNCADFVPVAGADLHFGALSFDGLNLVWDAAAGFPGCLGVDDVVRIVAVDDEVTGPTVVVSYAGRDVTVDLADADVVDFEGRDSVRVSDVLTLAALGVAAEVVEVDFEAGDGFRPSEHSTCGAHFPIAATALAGAYFELATRNLAWEASSGLPGCAFVDDVAAVHVTDAGGGDGPFVDVTFEDATVTVDLSDLEVVSFAGEPHVSLLAIVEAAALGTPAASLEFDFVAGDGYRASEAPTCAGTVPVAGDLLVAGFVSLETRDLEWSDESAMPGCVHVNDLAEVVALIP